MTLVAVIGAGPAGLAAAAAALESDAHVVIVDLNDSPGGQYHRQLPEAYRAANPERIQHDWARFQRLRDTILTHPNARWMANTIVFNLEARPDAAPRLHVVSGPIDGTSRQRGVIEPDAVVLATGAHDRVVPFPGWTLPGVFTAGAAQTLARTERVAVGRRVVVSGTGPFLLPVAQSLTDVGSEVVAVLEANPMSTLLRGWLPHPERLVAQRHKLLDLGHYAWHHARHRIPYRTGPAVIAARGGDTVQVAVTARLDADWMPIPGTEKEIAVDAICVGHGFTPALELAQAAGCQMATDPAGTFVAVDDTGRTTAAQVFAAGEITGIGGADCADVEGRVAGQAAAGASTIPAPLMHGRRAARKFVTRLATAHPLGAGWHSWLDDDTVVCRCESTTFGQLRRAQKAETSLRATRLGTRAGLGPCQGRFCGPNVDALCGKFTQHDRTCTEGTPAATAHNRPIAHPVRLGELAAAPSPPVTD